MTIYWNTKTAQYRREDGTIITSGELLAYVDQSLQAGRDAPMVRLSDGSPSIGTNELAMMVSTGLLPVGVVRRILRQLTTWYAQKYEQVKREVITMYMEGRGGREVMTSVDWGSCGGIIADQLRFLKPFAQQVEEGKLSEAQIAARSAMYINSAREAYYRGKARALGVPLDKLPAMPAGGSTKCLTNCRCEWRFEPVYDESGELIGWDCFWELNPAEHCEDCMAYHAMWYPLFVEA